MADILRSAFYVGLLCAAPLAEAQVAPQRSATILAPPPPVPEIYDPRPGPYFVVVDDAGAIDGSALSIIANAADNWRGTTMEAFLLCFRPKSLPVNSATAADGLDNVAAALKARGAKIVAILPDRLCRTPLPSSRLEGLASVEIIGVIVPLARRDVLHPQN